MKSILLKASAGSGKTTRLTEEVFKRILIGGKFITALTFTRAATTEMRTRIMEEIAEKEELNLLERLRLIMEAGRVGYSTIDSFFYRLFAASGFAPKLTDEKAQMEILGEIEALFRDHVVQSGKANKIIVAARILRTDIDTLWGPLADEQTIERCMFDMARLQDLDDIIKENGELRKKLASIAQKANALADQVTAGVKNRVINYLDDYDDFISKTVATHSDLISYKSLGKTIDWGKKPYVDLNKLFKNYRKFAEELSINRALLRELAVAFLCEIYFEAADAVKKEEGLIFFSDVRRGLLALDGATSSERPKLMSNYFSLGLDRTEHLLIDEFQDTSKGDIEILLPLINEILSGRGERGERSFFAVGDWKQMIYGWRGADREALEEAIGSYIKNGIITESSLEYNYRSAPLLISFYNKLVENLFSGKEKTETQKPPERKNSFDGTTEVNLVELEKDGNSSAAFYPAILKFLKSKKSEYGCAWGDMAVLAMTNNHVQKIEAELIKDGIRVSAVKGRQLLSTREGVAVMLFLTGVLSNKKVDKQFAGMASELPLWIGIFGNIEDVRAEFAEKFPQPFGLMAVICAIEKLRGKLSATILDIWQDEAQSFFIEGGTDVDGFLLRMFNTRFNVKVPEADNSANIKVDTIHGTKGLQFKHVFVYWNEDEKEPPIYLDSAKCNVQFTSRDFDFLNASESSIAREIIEKRENNLARLRREKANVFYVAATRAIQTLTIFLPTKKDGNYKTVHQAVLNTFSVFAPTGSKKEKCSSPGAAKDLEAITIYNVPEKHNDEPEKYNEIDPALVSDYIRAGIMRGDRLHRWLANVMDKDAIPQAGELSDEEYDTAVRFLNRSDVAPVMFRQGKLYIEQQISDKESFGIVDRMIVSDDLITIIDYKSGSMRGLKYKYDEQLRRYTKIMKTLYPHRKVEYYILSIDD